jgi:DNA-nicking Smr family endonuclease
MARKKRKQGPAEPAPQPKKPAPIGTAFGPLLERAGLRELPAANPAKRSPPAAKKGQHPPPPKKPAPSPASPPDPDTALTPREETLLQQAYAGVAPIARPQRGRVRQDPRSRAAAGPVEAAESAARERLAALVGGGVRFAVARDEAFVTGLREGSPETLLTRLRGAGFSAEAELDLHGLRSADIARAVSEFVRKEKRKGARYLLLITGKGQHSEGGVGVLRDAAIEALTRGGAAPSVLAFTSAHAVRGGTGALAVLLT